MDKPAALNNSKAKCHQTVPEAYKRYAPTIQRAACLRHSSVYMEVL